MILNKSCSFHPHFCNTPPSIHPSHPLTLPAPNSPSLFHFFLLLIPCPDPRSLEGIVDKLRSDELVDGVATQNLTVGDSDDEHQKYNALPGAQFFISCLVMSCLALPCLALPCLALPCLALPCLALPCLAKSYLAMPCPTCSCVDLCCIPSNATSPSCSSTFHSASTHSHLPMLP